MNKALQDYLEEIRHYLVTKDNSDEILKEIESHIMDKLQEDGNEENEEAINRAIQDYGSPGKVAEKYLEGNHIIYPNYRNFLFLYTWLLFIFHYGLNIVSYVFGITFRILPFGLSISVSSWTDLIIQIPMTWVYDFGLIALILYFITQSPGDTRLVWPKFFKQCFSLTEVKNKKLWLGWLLLFLFVILLIAYIRQGSIFFMNPGEIIKPDPAERPEIYNVLSIIVLFILGLESMTIFLKNWLKSLWVNFANSISYLISCIVLLNIPKAKIIPDPEFHVLITFLAWIIGIIMMFVVYDIICVLKTILTRK